MKNIILITDGIHSNMLKKSLKADVNVKLFIDIEDFWNLTKNELLNAKNIIKNNIEKINNRACIYIYKKA